VTALSALLLVEAGDLDVDAPVARYWPGFEAEGKDGVLVRHLMSHTAGLPAWTEPITGEDLYDWDKCTTLLARQAPWWEPGTAIGYHAISQGYLVGEVVRRITGATLGTFFRQQLAEPLGADFHIGTPAECDDRVARVIPPPPLDQQLADLDPTSIPIRALTNPLLVAEQSWEIPWRRAEIPAAGGHGNARSVAVVQSALLGDRLSDATRETVFREQADDVDLVLGAKLRHGIGYGLNSTDLPVSPNDRACFWGGWGGSLVINDLDARMTFAYVMNKMGEGTLGDARGAALAAAAYASL
jgi:CubicO group peptidase (beta-lactamase class C family)